MTPYTNNSQSLYTHTLNVNNVRVCKVGCELITVKIWHAHGCCVYVYMSMSSQCVLSGAMDGVIMSVDHSLSPPWTYYSLKMFKIPCISTYPNRLAYVCKDAFKLYWVTEKYTMHLNYHHVQLLVAIYSWGRPLSVKTKWYKNIKLWDLCESLIVYILFSTCQWVHVALAVNSPDVRRFITWRASWFDPLVNAVTLYILCSTIAVWPTSIFFTLV